ncbi:alpha-glucan family phosphorylase [Candidatus Woesearchaeota archaeon]|nr:alpha-glucan family phosphorylase [Candidatus Woesearchaeota archaeon]
MALKNTSQLTQMVRNRIAYFSMEIGFRSDIPTYSGGLGVLAGDTMKSMADIGIDAVGVTLLSEHGYFTQHLDEHGYQYESPTDWPVKDTLHKLDVSVNVYLHDRVVKVNVWEYELVGVLGKSIKLYFLDTNDEANDEQDRLLTAKLYGGDNQYRLKQEIILGIGGVKVLRELGYNPRKFHMNEGHAAFLILELYRELDDMNCISEDCEQEKLDIIRQHCSFTTHTPVAAGHDEFDEQQVRTYLGTILPDNIFNLVKRDGKFSMTRLALQFSSYVNAVARKHQEVSKRMFPEYDIDYITNGVHSTTWVNPHFAALYDKYIIDWRENPLELRNARKIPIAEFRHVHEKAKKDLFSFIKQTTGTEFDAHIFTIGFARRATSYKRADLLFKDINRLKDISRRVGRIQLIFAGKAHPNDHEGKLLIQRIVHLAQQLTPTIKLVFLQDYNMDIAQRLVSGVDLWLNTPQRPLEASGTSGMKAAHNGVPSLSVPDGWWIEGLMEDATGWGIGEEVVYEQDYEKVNWQDAQQIYEKLEQKILPLYYQNNDEYVAVMRRAVAINGAYFNTQRMVDQYLVRAYARNN